MKHVFFLVLVLVAPLLAGAEEPIKVGAIFSLSSWGAHGGTTELNGALIARDEINSAGGIKGRPIELIIEDTQSDFKTTASAFRKLLSVDGVVAVVGPNWAEFTEIAVPIAEAAKVPLISPSGYSEGMLKGKRFAFTLQPPHTLSTKPLADLLKNRGYKAVTVVLAENAYLNGIFEGFRKNTSEPDKVFSTVMRFNPEQADFRSVISKIKASDADAVLVLLLEGGGLSNFFVQAKQLNIGLPLYSANGIPYDQIIMKDWSIAEGVTYFDYIISGGPGFIGKYKARFKEEPGFASGRAYEAVYMIKRAIEGCGIEPVRIRECLSASRFPGHAGEVSFDSEGQIQTTETNTRLLRVTNAKPEPVGAG